jgi:hypothetical protein
MTARRRRTAAIALCAALICDVSVVLAQGKGSQGSSGGAPSAQAPAPAGLQGLSFSKSQWPTYLTKLPSDKHLVVICYKMAYTNSVSQPFVLQPTPSISYKSDPNRSVPCTVLDEKHTLQMDQLLVVAIDAQDIDIGKLKILNINATDQQGTSINPTPLRPSFGASTASTNLGGDKVYFLTWPNRIAGDVIRTISINAVLTPAPTAGPWTPLTFYPAGSVVTTTAQPGQYYISLAGGVSSTDGPSWTALVPASVVDGALTWQHIGAAPPAGATVVNWQASTNTYKAGAVLLAPNGNYYLLTLGVPGGSSGTMIPPFPITVPADITEPDFMPRKTTDSTVQWIPNRSFHMTCGAKSDTEQWLLNTRYAVNDVVCDPVDHAEYKAVTGGTSGGTKPTFAPPTSPAHNEYQIVWTQAGSSLPVGVTPGQGPDQTVNLLTLQLPQSHTRSTFNLAAGVVISSVTRPAFSVPSGLTGTNTTAAQVRTSNNPTIEPLLLLTVYPWPIDAEQPCVPLACLWQNAPGLNVGFSLTSPTSSFYLGLSLELFRNIELVLGDNFQIVQRLPSPPVAISNAATTATTSSTFANGVSAGLTFNISGFIQGVVGSASAAAGGGGSK